MSNTINLSDAASHERVEGRFLINHATVAQAVYAPDADEHHKIISQSNTWAINVVNAQYVAGTSVPPDRSPSRPPWTRDGISLWKMGMILLATFTPSTKRI